MKYAQKLPEYAEQIAIGKKALVEFKGCEKIGKIISIKETTFTIQTEENKKVWRPYSKLIKVLGEKEITSLSSKELNLRCLDPKFDYWNYALMIWNLSTLIQYNPNFKYWEYILTNEHISRLCRYRADFEYWKYYLVEDNIRMLKIHRSDFNHKLVKMDPKAKITDKARRVDG